MTEEEAAPRSGRRGPTRRVVAFPEPTIQTTSYAPVPFSPSPLAPVPSAPLPPAEEPATLHPSDRRTFGYVATPPAPSPTSSRYAAVDQLAIGEIDQTLFDCPACRRPLALGTRRCPGCGSLLVRSVLLRKAALFAVAGGLVGGLLGLGGGFVLGGAGAAAGAVVPGGPTASGTPAGSVAPSSTARPGGVPASPSTVPATPVATTPPAGTLPLAVKTAFVQLIAANAHLGDAETELRAALSDPAFDASAVASTLRSISAQTLFTAQLAAGISAWSDGGQLGSELVAYYANLHDTAAVALDNSVRNTKAYQSAARSIAKLLDGRAAIDASIRAAADAAGDPLPATAP